MIMANLFADCFPNLFLRVQVWAGGRKEKDLQTRMLFQDFVNELTTMPGSPIPKQENGHTWNGFQDQFQMLCRNFSIHKIGTHRDFLSGLQIQRAVEIGLGSSRIRSHNRCLSSGKPNLAGGGLQVQPGFIASQEDRIGRFLSYIYQFFSSCSSKSATFVALRDLKTFSVF